MSLRLLLDASATCNAASVLRVRLRDGAAGAVPHRHNRSSELFYVLDGGVDLLAGDTVLHRYDTHFLEQPSLANPAAPFGPVRKGAA